MLHKLHNPLADCDIKFDTDKTGEFTGYASVFGGVDAYGDTILPGAYSKFIDSGRKVSGFINHDSSAVPVIDWVKLSEDDHGLLVRGKIDLNHKDGPTVHSAMKRGAMDGLSIGYRIPKGGGVENDHGGMDLSEIILKEISVVNFPADDAARIAIVKYEVEQIETLKDAEAFLRDAGYSKSAAKAFISRIMDLKRRDATQSDDEIKDVTESLVDFITKL